MIKPGPHKVGTLKINCLLQGGAVGLGQARTTAAHWADMVMDEVRRLAPRLLDDAMNDIDNGQPRLIDRLEIDLGSIHFGELETELRRSIASSLTALPERLKTADEQRLEWFWTILREYLLTGITPWNAGNFSTEEWRDGLEMIFADPATGRRLRSLLARNQAGLNRLAALKSGVKMSESPIEFFEADEGSPVVIEKVDEAAREKKIFVSNAGLVLTAPFLPHFFRRLGLLSESEGNSFDGTSQRQRAVAIAQLIVRPDQPEMAEGDLALNKLLCGWPLTEALSADSFKDLKAMFEVKNLLRAVISQWQGLSQATPGGLVKHFLQRDGILYLTDYPRLEVERRPHDLLLDTLPWVLSIIQTPWMERPMQVIWND
ncbi:hypothetical protein C4J81_05660 [Deltaproteobacteria bacterium Smac51]|nr:hypothetical protein C4J81_05660 [Deltaproteobacteria bacterium Smac51]